MADREQNADSIPLHQFTMGGPLCGASGKSATNPTDVTCGACKHSRALVAVLDVIAPRDDRRILEQERWAIFVWGDESIPTDEEMYALAERIVHAIEEVIA